MSTGAAAAIGMVAILLAGFWVMYALGRMHGATEVRREWTAHIILMRGKNSPPAGQTAPAERGR